MVRLLPEVRTEEVGLAGAESTQIHDQEVARLALERNYKCIFRMSLIFASVVSSSAQRPNRYLPVPPSGVIGVTEDMLSPDYWIDRAPEPNRILMDTGQVEARNRRLFKEDKNVVDLKMIGPRLRRQQILGWMKETGPMPKLPQLDANGHPIALEALNEAVENSGASKVLEDAPVQFGLAVRRTILRSFPTAVQAYPSRELTDFDSFAGGVLFPGDPVVIAHTSEDGKWLLVVTTQGPEWAAKSDIAEGSAEQVFGFVSQRPFRVSTGDQIRTVYTPEEPRVSETLLDMGTRLPIANLAENRSVNGQGPYESWTVILPVRNGDGSLAFQPALLRRTSDSSNGYLPLTRANIIRQSFKFLGERYGWGHTYNGRDCSGFTGDTYRSMGLILPGNAGQQGSGPTFYHETFTASDSHTKRVNAVMNAQVGDLVVVPGHVMMILGRANGQPYVIQDVPFAVFHDEEKTEWTKLNEVSVTPLLPLLADEKTSYVDAMTSLVHVTQTE